MSSTIENRLNTIEKQLNEYNKKLLNAETLYQDETRMRRIIQEQFIPIITVSKENMITNCYKVEELKQTREEIDGVHQAIRQFQHNLEIIQEFEIRCDRLESDFHSEMHRLRKDLAPNQQKQQSVHTKLEGLLSFQKEYKNDQQIRDQRVSDLENQFLDHQQKMQKLLLNEFAENHHKIESLEKQISNINNMAESSHVYFQKCKEQFEEVNSTLLKQEMKILSIKMDLKDQLQGKIESIFQNYLNINTQIIDLFDKFKDIKNFMNEIQTQVSSQNSKFTEIQQFLIYQQPIVTQLQISDLFQEFLCVPDQMKLIEYDNHKFAQLKQFQSNKSLTQNSLNSSLPQNQKNQSCIQIFNQNIQTFLNTIIQEQSGAIRINFSKDIHADLTNLQRRTKEIAQDLKLKASLTKRVYKFEKQVFIIQGKIKGDIVQTQDLLEEVHSRDKHDFIDGRKYDEQAQQDSLINLNDPNHKLKQQVKFINKDHLIKLYLENDRITRKRNEEQMLANQQIVKNIQEEQQINENALQNRRQARRNNNRQVQQSQEDSQGSRNQIVQQNKSLTGSNNFQRPLFAQEAKFDSASSLLPYIKSQNDQKQSQISQDMKHEKSASSNSQNLQNNHIKIHQNQQIQMNQSISLQSLQKQELEELNLKMGLLQNVKITVNPDFHLLPETNICSRCAFKGHQMDVVKNNNHILNIAPPRQVIYETIFIKSEKKINRIHHRFLGKKRNWLTRQIDPAKRYLYMIEKNAKINQINSDGEIDLDAGGSISLSKNILKESSSDEEKQSIEQDTKIAVKEIQEEEKKIEANFSAEKKKKNDNQSFNSQVYENNEKLKSAALSENLNVQKMRSKGPSLSVIQQLIQNELQKMKTVIEVQFQTKMSILNSTTMSKLQSFTSRLDTQGNSLSEFKHVTNKAMIKQYETLEKRMQSIELNQDYIEDQFKQKTKEYEDLIDKQELHIIEFKDYINHELIQFYKNKKRVQTEIQSHSREYKTKFKVLADLNEEFSFKLSYIDKMLPIIVEQSKFTYSLLLQDLNNRQKLAESLKTSQIQDNGYLLLEKLRCMKSMQQKDLDDEKLKEILFQLTQKLLSEQKNDKLSPAQKLNNQDISQRVNEQSKQAPQQQQNKFELSNFNQIPDKYIENQLKNSQGGLYLDVMNYRNQTIYSKKIETYLEKMTEKLEILMDNVQPYKDFWSQKDNNIEEINILSNYHKTVSDENEDLIKSSQQQNSSHLQKKNEKNSKDELQIKRRKIFDDIHLGKLNEFIKDAYFVQKLDLHKICQLVSQQELDQSNLADKFLKDYLNEVQVKNDESSLDQYPDENLSQHQKYIRNILSIRAASAGQLMKPYLNYKKRDYEIKETDKDITEYNFKSAQITKKNQTILAQQTLNGHNQSNAILTSNQSKKNTTFQKSSSQINIYTMQRNTPDNKKNNINIQNNKTSEMNSPADKSTENKESQFQFNQLKENSEFNIGQQQKQQILQNSKLQNKLENKSIFSQSLIKQTKTLESNKIYNSNLTKFAKNSQSVLNLDRKTDSIVNQDFERSQKLIRDLSNSNVLRNVPQNDISKSSKKTVLVAKMLNGNTHPIHTNSNTDILQISQNNVQMSNQKHSVRDPKRNEMQSANHIQQQNRMNANGAQDLIQFLNSSNSYNMNRNKQNSTFINEGSSHAGILGDMKNNYQSQNQFMNHSLLQRNIPQNKRDHASTTISNQQINLVNSQLQQLLNMKNSQL